MGATSITEIESISVALEIMNIYLLVLLLDSIKLYSCTFSSIGKHHTSLRKVSLGVWINPSDKHKAPRFNMSMGFEIIISYREIRRN